MRRIAIIASVVLFIVVVACVGQQNRARAGCIIGGGFICVPAAVAASFSLTNTATAVDNTSQTTYTFASQNFGAADSTRVVAILLYSRNAGGTAVIATSATIGGVSATNSAGASSLGPGNGDTAELWYAAVPTGTSGSIVANYSVAPGRAGISIYAIIAPSSATPVVTGTSVATPLATTFTIPSGGAAIGGFFSTAGFPGTPAATPAGFNNLDMNNNISVSQGIAAFHSNAGVITGSQSLTMTITSQANGVGNFAAWGP